MCLWECPCRELEVGVSITEATQVGSSNNPCYVFAQLKGSYEGKCKDLDRAKDAFQKLKTNPQSKPNDVQKVG